MYEKIRALILSGVLGASSTTHLWLCPVRVRGPAMNMQERSPFRVVHIVSRPLAVLVWETLRHQLWDPPIENERAHVQDFVDVRFLQQLVSGDDTNIFAALFGTGAIHIAHFGVLEVLKKLGFKHAPYWTPPVRTRPTHMMRATCEVTHDATRRAVSVTLGAHVRRLTCCL